LLTSSFKQIQRCTWTSNKSTCMKLWFRN